MNKMQPVEVKERKTLYDKGVFGNNLKRLREKKGYTQAELLSKFEKYEGITLDIRQYRDYENNKSNYDMSSQRLYVLSDILGVSMNDLVGKTFDPKSMNDTIFNSTGLTPKSIDILKRKRKIREHMKKIKSKHKSQNISNSIVCSNISSLDEVDVLNYLIENSNILTLFINSAKLAHIQILELQQKQKELEIELSNTNNKENKKKINKKLLEIKDKKKNIEDYQSFTLYNEVNKIFKKYLQYLRSLDTQHYITKK